MTIQNTTIRKAGPSQGNGVTTVFPFTFKVFTATDILVTYLDALAVESVLVLSTNYTVSLNADQNTSPGGSVTLLVAPVTATYITLTSQLANTQTLALTNSGGFYPESINNALDRTVIEIQQLAEQASRSIAIPKSSTASPLLPSPAANNVLVWNNTATALINLPATAGTSLVDLAASTGSTLVGTTNGGTGAVTRTVASKLNDIVNSNDFSSTPSFNTAKVGHVSIDSSLRLRSELLIAGDAELTGAANRDAIVVGRNLVGLTDCHGFADKTVISGVTDYGGYGSYDCTAVLQGSNAQDHFYTIQDRFNYAGTTSIANQAGLYSIPYFTGSGTWDVRCGVKIADVLKTGTGTLNENIGVLVQDLDAGTLNVGVNIQQSTGYAIYASGVAPSYHAGNIGIGALPTSDITLRVSGSTSAGDVAINIAKTLGYSIYTSGTGATFLSGTTSIGNTPSTAAKFTVQGTASTGARAYLDSSATSVSMGGFGADVPLQIANNGAIRLELTASSGAYTFRPAADNTQPLGDLSHRWAQLYAGTATINTSDERLKQQIRSINNIEKAVAVKLKSLIKVFKYTDAVEAKGNGARMHVGIIAQEVKAAFESEGLVAEEYGILCYSEWEAAEEILAQDGTVLKAATPAGNRYGIRYEELLAFIISAL